jgi:hypothetical protein
VIDIKPRFVIRAYPDWGGEEGTASLDGWERCFTVVEKSLERLRQRAQTLFEDAMERIMTVLGRS